MRKKNHVLSCHILPIHGDIAYKFWFTCRKRKYIEIEDDSKIEDQKLRSPGSGTYSKRLPSSVTPLLHITDYLQDSALSGCLNFFSVILHFLSFLIPLCLPSAPLRRFFVQSLRSPLLLILQSLFFHIDILSLFLCISSSPLFFHYYSFPFSSFPCCFFLSLSPLF